MNKIVIGILVVAVIAIVLGSVGYVSAQTPTPQTPGTGYGQGMMGGRGGRGSTGGGMQSAAGVDEDGLLHDAMIKVYAQKLGLSVEELNARLAKGETMAQIATSKGLTAAQFSALMTDARTQAIAQAVKDGTLTQEQADWMSQRGAGMMGQGGQGMMGGRGAQQGTQRGGMGMRGAGQAGCPFTQTTP